MTNAASTADMARLSSNDGPRSYIAYLDEAALTYSTIRDSVRPDSANEDPLRRITGSDDLSNVVVLPSFKPQRYLPTEHFAALQEWEGVIREVCEDKFFADLYDLESSDDAPTQVAEISFLDIPEKDLGKVKPGAVFRWLVGRSRSRAGQSSGKWVIYFRPAFQKKTHNSFDGMKIPDSVLAQLHQD